MCLSVCVCLSICVCVSVCAGRDDDFERTKKTDFKGEYQGMKEEPVVCVYSDILSVSSLTFAVTAVTQSDLVPEMCRVGR